ncbi:efflux transporter, outer membrane factor (OMF) lipoprotein, NodT family [Sphingomonas laterariae]|uniref:Efflux transporter, outer membrane factor (OMF) lipoprotein, NodT family n=1 Tax=Edaphosphingomonas laterariae TaxID=861865 RepID=A0A239FYX0_9SPHN|nr:efflux transporter outer membrane subunit [Sphingomonas laterariae]SNS62237.1 efflux transporter, outer membrane factor (OMF) lipoprotein, NodT family [Sphingomonas laterariae]
MFSSNRPLSLFCLLAGLAGCAPAIDLPPPATPLPARFESQDRAAPAVPAQAIDRWWLLFGDAQLDGLIETALARSTSARSAYFRIREARAIYDQSVASTWPTGNIAASATAQDNNILSGRDVTGQGGRSNSYAASFSPSWELDLFGRLANVREGAAFDYEAAAFDYHASLMVLAADVGTTLFQARAIAVQLADARETLRIAEDLAASAQLGLAHGLVAGGDAARLESDVGNARAEVTRLEASLRATKRSLLVLVGRPDEPTDSLPIEAVLAPPPAIPAAAPGELLIRRPDVRAAQARLEAAAAGVEVDRLNLFPRLTLNASGGLSRTTGPFGVDVGFWSLGAGLAMPVLDRPRLMAQLRMSEARGNQAVVSYESAVQTAFREAENALTATAANRARLVDLDRATDRARYAFDAARKGYGLGLTDLTTLLQSERAWLATRTSYTAAKAQALTDTVSAFRALGGGWSTETPAFIPGQTPLHLPVAR